MKRITAAVLVLALLGAASCGDNQQVAAPPPAQQLPAKVAPEQGSEPRLRGAFVQRMVTAHNRYTRRLAERRGRTTHLLKTAATLVEEAATLVKELETEGLARRRGESGDLKGRLQKARIELKRAEFVHRYLNEPTPRWLGGRPSHVGKIVRTDSDNNVYWISLGEGDGVRPGFMYIISREQDYIATIRIYEVREGRSAGCALAARSQGEIEFGDRVLCH